MYGAVLRCMIRCMDLRCMSSSPCGRCFAFVAGGASRRAPGRALRGLAAAASAHGRDSSCHSPRAPPHISALTRYKFDVLRCTLYATVYAVCCIWLYKRVRYNHTAEPHCHATPVPSCTVYSSYSTYTVQPYSTYTIHLHTPPLRKDRRLPLASGLQAGYTGLDREPPPTRGL